MLAEVRTRTFGRDVGGTAKQGEGEELLNDNIEPTLLYTTNAKVDDDSTRTASAWRSCRARPSAVSRKTLAKSTP